MAIGIGSIIASVVLFQLASLLKDWKLGKRKSGAEKELLERQFGMAKEKKVSELALVKKAKSEAEKKKAISARKAERAAREVGAASKEKELGNFLMSLMMRNLGQGIGAGGQASPLEAMRQSAGAPMMPFPGTQQGPSPVPMPTFPPTPEMWGRPEAMAALQGQPPEVIERELGLASRAGPDAMLEMLGIGPEEIV